VVSVTALRDAQDATIGYLLIGTGLPNRSLFNDRLTHAIPLAKRHTWTLAVMFSSPSSLFPLGARRFFDGLDRIYIPGVHAWV
jgi:GGDEF domain-containing protein